MKKFSKRPGLKLCLVGLAAVLMYGGTAAAGELSVCIDKSSPAAAMDHGVARAVAAQQGNTLKVHEFDGSGRGDDGFSPKQFNKLAHDSCALVLGFPIDADEKSGLPGLHATTPYGHTGFVLVTAKGSKATNLDQLPSHTSVAVTYQTTPNLYFIHHPDLQADVHLSNEDALKALEQHTVHAAMLWQPTVVNYLSQRHEANRFAYHELHEPHAQFNLVALYDDANAPVAAAFDKSIAAMTASGELARILALYAETGPAQPTVHAAGRGQSASLWRPRTRRAAAHTCGSKPDRKSAAAAEDDHAAPPALFTDAQATEGKQKFLDNCARCHGPMLEGRAGPALKGPNFASTKSDFHVGDIFTIVSQNMPATAPGSLEHQDYVAIMAFLLQQNGYPAGSKALTFDGAKGSKVDLIYRGN
ncbi:MAG: transporter substrate-binding domain-containing protein [Rhodanobacter sp.]|jgi:mono/diheme cytochrome c family protein